MIGAVVSACYGQWDTIRPVVPQDGATIASWVMVHDDPKWAEFYGRYQGWRMVYEPRSHNHPCLAAKVPKFRPDLYHPTGVDYSIWVDASATLGNRFAEMCVSDQSPWSLMAMFPHPHRVSLMEETIVSRTLPKYDTLPLEAQVRYYIDREGYPDPWMLWASGCIVRRDPALAFHKRFGDMWMGECVRWGFQDQLSLSYLLWREGVLPGVLPGSVFDNPHIQFGPHNA